MALQPETLTRLAIVAHKDHQPEVIETLHDLRIAHIEEVNPEEGEEIRIGDPLPEASEASEKLVQIRSLKTTLDVDGEPDRTLPRSAVRDQLEHELDEIADEVHEASDRRDELARELNSIENEIEALDPFRDLPLDLEDYRGYENLEAFAGEGPEDLQEALEEELTRFELFEGEDLQAVFVASDESEEAQELLVREGFRAVEVPDGEGSPSQRIRELEREASRLEQELEDAEAELERLADTHRDFLLCAEEELAIVVEKAEAPLDFGATDRTFFCDAWIPRDRIDDAKTAVSEAANGRVHFETLDDGQRDVHREDEPPTLFDHSGPVRPFGFLMETFSTPKYDEIDPTLILSIVFPLFLGFMIGDLGYGVLMLGIGLLLYRRIGPKSEAAESLGFAIAIAGGWSILFGAIVFQDALGIPLIDHGGGGLNWEGLLGVHLGALHGGIFKKAFIHKIGTSGVKSMLALSVLAAFVHLFLGYVFGFVNHLGHDTKHAVAQIGWLVTLTGLFVLTILHAPANAVSGFFVETAGLGTFSAGGGHGAAASIHATSFAQMLPWYLLAPGVLILVLTEGFMGIMETFSLFANVISYTRLAGVAVAKGGMAAAFNSIFLSQMALPASSGPALIVAGFVLFVVAQLIIFVLGILSSGVQGIRLNYVEFFLKFFEGGGERFSPFGRERRFTTETDTR